jgi:Ni,Fe-hydrogenase III large subunit
MRFYDDTPSLQDRTCATGRVSKALVERWAAGGFVGRGSGRSFDTRRALPYPPYDGAAFDVPVLTEGDVNARVWVRAGEIEQSIRMLKAWLSDLPSSASRVPVPEHDGTCEGIAMVEAFRGAVAVRTPGAQRRRRGGRKGLWNSWC